MIEMKYSLPTSYYRMMAEYIVHHELIFWNEDKQCFMDEIGCEIDILDYLPPWALYLAKLHRGPDKDNYFAFTPNAWTLIEIFWPDEEREENWYT